MLGFPELLMILAVVLVVFGAGKAADLGKALGKGIHDFNRVKEEGEKLLKEPLKEVQNLPKLVESFSATQPEALDPKPPKEHPPGSTSL
jgi:sec-independent protein translocase protein TatA